MSTSSTAHGVPTEMVARYSMSRSYRSRAVRFHSTPQERRPDLISEWYRGRDLSPLGRIDAVCLADGRTDPICGVGVGRLELIERDVIRVGAHRYAPQDDEDDGKEGEHDSAG